eukprot:4271845-Amphidinium_carterae.1
MPGWPARCGASFLSGDGHFVGPVKFTIRMQHSGFPMRLCAKALAPSFCTALRLKEKLVNEEFNLKKWAKKMAPTTSMPNNPCSRPEKFE